MKPRQVPWSERKSNMVAYIIRRLLLIIPTLLLVMAINFVVIQMAPGGPIEQALAHLEGIGDANIDRVTQAQSDVASQSSASRGSQGLRQEYIDELRKQYGFDKPVWQRFTDMVKSYARFDFGESYFKGRPVIDLVVEKMPVSISLGLWSTLIVYLISIPLGIKKAVNDGSRFDIATSVVLTIFAAIPGFLFAVLLLVVFAGGVYFDWFPLRGLVSDNFEQLSFFGKIADYFWHLVLPITAISIGGFASLTMLTKNSFLDQLHQQYVLTARAKGLDEQAVMYGHIFRNAMLIIIAGFPSAFVGIFFTGALFIEIIFSLNGLGLLGYEAALARDYPVMFGTLWVFTLIGLLLQLVTDVVYTIVDPRIDFSRTNT